MKLLFGSNFDAAMQARLDADAANVMRRAPAGMLWTRQFYDYDADNRLKAEPKRSRVRRDPCKQRKP
jgi:hypothetical protein